MKVIGKKVKIIGIVVAVILIIAGVTAVIMLMRRSLTDPKIVSEIRSAMQVGPSRISDAHQKIISKRKADIANFANDAFPEWTTKEEEFSKLTLFAIELLELNVPKDDPSKCRSIVESIINSIISKLKLSFGPLFIVPWVKNWYPFSIYVTRLFVMYEYLGDDSNLKRECHDQLIRITPSLGMSFQSTHEGENLFYVAVPRLCSNYLFEPDQFTKDQSDPQFKKLEAYLEFPIVKTNEVKEGRYADGSWIYSGNVASYVEARKYNEFYDRMYRLLGFSSKLKEGAESIFPKLLHPKIPFLPLGLVGRSGKVLNYKYYPNMTISETGVFVMPFMGFGIFKTPNFLFYVRVQRPGIAAFQAKKFKDDEIEKNTNNLGLGWVQLRKLYRKNYEKHPNKIVEFTWKNLQNQPGLLTFANENEVDLLNVFKVPDGRQTKSFMTKQETLNSYIGQLNANSEDISKKLLFWLNIYDFDDVYKGACEVTEAAIVTEQGLQAYYIINNKTSKLLKFICKDEQTEWKVKINNREAMNDYHAVAANRITEFSWQVLQSDIDYKVKYESGVMTFEFNGKKYKITYTVKNETYVVKDGDDDHVVLTGFMNNKSSSA